MSIATLISSPRLTPRETLMQVEKRLRSLWEPKPGEKAQARVCTANLVFVTTDETIAERYQSVIDEVIVNMPSRAILLVFTAIPMRDPLVADVSAVCGVGENAPCSERVTIICASEMKRHAASIAESLRLSELPSTLIWLGKISASDPLFESLSANVERVIIDSEYSSIESAIELIGWSDTTGGDTAVSDLAWTRMAPWQELTARMFDDPKLEPFVRCIRSVEIWQAGTGDALGAEPVFFLSWLATTLGWTRNDANFSAPDGSLIQLRIERKPEAPAIAPLALLRIVLTAELDGVVLRGIVEHDEADGTWAPDRLRWSLEVDLPSATNQVVPLGANKAARILERTLRRSPLDPAFIQAARFARSLVRQN